MPNCPNCGQPVEAGASLCPNCGAPTRPLPARRALTGIDWLDLTLGFLLAVLSFAVFGVGILGAVAAFFVTREKYPGIARGLQFGMLTVGALVLGALAICVAMFTQGRLFG
jgi:zinc-ribbon domain